MNNKNKRIYSADTMKSILSKSYINDEQKEENVEKITPFINKDVLCHENIEIVNDIYYKNKFYRIKNIQYNIFDGIMIGIENSTFFIKFEPFLKHFTLKTKEEIRKEKITKLLNSK